MKALLITLTLMSTLFTQANDGAYLDPAYESIISPLQDENSFNKSGIVRSDFEEAVEFHSPVRAQGQRGTCSIFSATAMLEARMVQKFNMDPEQIDLSEEWLEYLVMRQTGSEGSHSFRNFEYIKYYGSPGESAFPYIGETWKTLDSSPLGRQRCSNVQSSYLKHCLLAHRNPFLLDQSDDTLLDQNSSYYDPTFQNARTNAYSVRDQYIQYSSSNYSVRSVTEIKQRLRNSEPLVLDADFFYGAWNHKKAAGFGLNTNKKHWKKGIVFYPSRNSKDYTVSRQNRAGHSVVVVGYDDNIVVKKEVIDANGNLVTESYKGIYYIKNSWGRDGFGKDFEFNGKSYPGFGMITQKYAHEYGGFYRMPLE